MGNMNKKLIPFIWLLIALCGAGFLACNASEESEKTSTIPEDDDDDLSSNDDDDDDDDDAEFDITFFAVADTHCNPNPDIDLTAMVNSISAVASSGAWPELIEGRKTHFTGEKIGNPLGVIFLGDITGSGSVSALGNELDTFRRFYEVGSGPGAISFPAYVGLGNHDLDRDDIFAETYRAKMWAYVEQRHKEQNAPVPVLNFDADSRNYSWDWGGVHLIQSHKCPTDTSSGQVSAIDWLSQDLIWNASGGRPVLVFQHYGFDAFGQQDRWWTAADRAELKSTLDEYNVIGVFAGHSHFAKNYTWEELNIFQVNNAKAEIGQGNYDGNGSFTVVRITNERFEMMTCRWLDENGNYEFVQPFYSEDILVSE